MNNTIATNINSTGVHEWVINARDYSRITRPDSVSFGLPLRQTLIVHIGAGGGTGGPVMSSLLRTLAGLPKHHRDTFAYIAVDGDKFEAKNLGRQLCTPGDLGKFKVSCLVSKMKRVYSDLEDSLVLAVPRYIDSKETLENVVSLGLATLGNRQKAYEESISEASPDQGQALLLYTDRESTSVNVVIIDSVDRNSCRRIITEYGLNCSAIGKTFLSTAKRVVHVNHGYTVPIPKPTAFTQISCGNGAWTGQTLIGGHALCDSAFGVAIQRAFGCPAPTIELPDGKVPSKVYEAMLDLLSGTLDLSRDFKSLDPYYYTLPLPGLIHPELLDEELDKQEDAMSCSERAVANVQNLIANAMGACAATNYMTALMFQQMHSNTSLMKVYTKRYRGNYSGTSVFFDTPQGTMDTYSLKNRAFYFNSIANSVRTDGLTSDDMVALEAKLIKEFAARLEAERSVKNG